MKTKSFLVKLTQWEHWPTLIYYIPLFPFFVIRSIKGGHLAHYLATNPGIFYSGSGSESKTKTLELVQEKYRPNGFFVSKQDNNQTVLIKLKKSCLKYPIIAKPDIGFRGYLVKKINNQEELINYLNTINEDILIQEFIPYHNELGIFYYRIPGEDKGKITSITIKKFISIIGDGKSVLSELILNDERAFLYHKIFSNIHKDKMNTIIKKGEKIVLTEIGNHSKGTQFLNGNHLINNELDHFINDVCKQIKGWYYGRLDIKYKDYDSLLKAKDFKILEVNGIISEPTHIYDASHKNASFINALKAINNHWEIMSDIAIKNHKKYGIEYPKVIPYYKNMLWLRSYTKKLKALNKKDF